MKSLFLGDIDDAVRNVIKYFDKQTGMKANDIYKKDKLAYGKLFMAKEYDNVFYFTKSIDNLDNLSDFISLLDSSNNVKKYVYIIRCDKFNLETTNKKLEMIKELLETYSKKTEKNIIVLNLSCLYGKKFIDGEINFVRKKAVSNTQIANYINIDDFSHFLYLLSTHKVNERYIELKAPKSFVLKQLIEKKVIDEINETLNLPFEWKPIHSISDEKDINKLIKEKDEKKKNPAIKIIEILVMFFIFEILNNVFRTTLNLQFIDFRLIFIVIIAIYYNFRYSLFATSIAIISFLFTNLKDVYDISILSNTDNWIAIITYIILTIIINNKIKRFENENKLANDKIEKLEKQNQFKERNLKKYEIKIKELNKAIIMHDKSFSKIENIITKYQKITLENVYEIFSSALETKNVVVFAINENKFTNAYITQNIDYSALLQRAPKDFINESGIWVNNDLDKTLPLYIVPIFNEDTLCFLVSIWDYEINIVNHDYRNNLVSLSKITSLLKENEE